MKKFFVNVEIEMADGSLEFEWFSVSAPDGDTAIAKVYNWLEHNTDYREWCTISGKPMLITDID